MPRTARTGRSLTPSTPPAVSAPGTILKRDRLTADERRRVEEALAEELAPATRIAYSGDWREFADWCDRRRHVAMPAEPEVVAAYLTLRADTHAMATVSRSRAAIAAAHRLCGQENPCEAALVARTMRSLARRHGTGQRQADALLDDVLDAVRATACLPRPRGRGKESEQGAMRRGLMDIALCQVMRDAGLRRSEASALVWEDIAATADGTGTLLVRKSKTDQEGVGRVVALTADAMHDLGMLRQTQDPTEERVFPLTDGQISRRIRSATRAAGVEGRYTGHSGRVGMARKMVASGAPTPIVMHQGRWKTPTMVSAYTRNEEASAAVPYLDRETTTENT